MRADYEVIHDRGHDLVPMASERDYDGTVAGEELREAVCCNCDTLTTVTCVDLLTEVCPHCDVEGSLVPA